MATQGGLLMTVSRNQKWENGVTAHEELVSAHRASCITSWPEGA